MPGYRPRAGLSTLSTTQVPQRITDHPIDGIVGESFCGFWPEGCVATERYEFDRAAWRVKVARKAEPERLAFVNECSMHT